MEGEMVFNGSHEPETETTEKILKPRKPKNSVMNLEDDNSVMQNGNSESGSVSDLVDDNNVENGHVEEPSKNAIKQNENGSLFEENVRDLKEGHPKKSRRESRAIKESTPKPETPLKRELRRRETTPRASTPKKQLDPPLKNLSNKKQNEDLESQIKENKNIKLVENCEVAEKIEQNDHCKESVLASEDKANEKSKGHVLDKSIIILNESDNEDIISVNESVEIIEQDTDKSNGFFSIFRKSFKSYSPSVTKDSFADSPSSPSVICLDSPIVDSSCPSTEIKGRKAINSFSKFPGRTVSITSLDRSIKRKADVSFDSSDKKRFAGDIENGSEESPGWRFYSSWSPSGKPRSTPLLKRAEGDSMAVNYDENTNLSLAEEYDTKESSTTTTGPKKWCVIM